MAYVTSVERIAMEEGKLEGKLESAETMIREFGISVKDAALKLKLPMDVLNEYLKRNKS